MPLQFLEFDLSEDPDGLCTWDGLASPAASHTTAMLAEVQTLLDQLHHRLGPPGPIEDGHAWDMDLQIHDEAGQALSLQATPASSGRITLAFSLSGGHELAAHLS